MGNRAHGKHHCQNETALPTMHNAKRRHLHHNRGWQLHLHLPRHRASCPCRSRDV